MTATVPQSDTEHERLLVVVVDRAHARFFQVNGEAAVELPSLASPAMRGGKFHSDRQGGPGWGEHDYHDRLREEERRHYGAIAARLRELARREPTPIVLAGPGQAPAALKRALPRALAEQVIGSARLNPTEVTPASVRRAAIDVRRAHQQEAERARVAELQEGLGSGRAENGTRAVLAALAKRQVRTLLVNPDVRGTGFRCEQSGRLVLSAADCRGEGEPQPVPDVIGEAVAEARRQGAPVIVIRDRDAAKAIDGLAALLRFRARA